jgi:hypothetical protein
VDREFEIPADSWIMRLSKPRQKKKAAEEVRPHGAHPIDLAYYEKLAQPSTSKLSDLAKIKCGLLPKPEKKPSLAATGGAHSRGRSASPPRARTQTQAAAGSAGAGAQAGAGAGGAGAGAGAGASQSHESAAGGGNGGHGDDDDAASAALAVTMPAAQFAASEERA